MAKRKRKSKGSEPGRPLKIFIESLERKHSDKKPWHCTECHVMNLGSVCQNCGRNFYGEPGHGPIPESEREMRPGLRKEASAGFVDFEP